MLRFQFPAAGTGQSAISPRNPTASAASTLGYKSVNSQHLSFQYADTKANNKFRADWLHQFPIGVAEVHR